MDQSFKKKNDFRCTAFQGSRQTNFMAYVHSIGTYVDFLSKQNVEWSVINIYNRRSGQFIKRLYKNDPIPKDADLRY